MCSLQPGRTLFAKNSDRPPDEVQVIERFAARPGGDPSTRLATTYLELDDPGSAALVGSRPTWQWGLEHGVNQHGVAIGNEQLWTVDDPEGFPEALTGLDLVRLGLERGRSALGALDAMVALLDSVGQGGIADRHEAKAYFSSFLIVDGTEAWILETSGATWAARPVSADERGAALSNRICLSTDWTRASADVARAGDFDRWRRATSPTAHADRRLAVTRPVVAPPVSAPPPDERDLAAVLRDHGHVPRPAGRAVGPLPPAVIDRQGTGVSVCLHLTGVQATTAALIVSIPRRPAPDQPIRAWAALGSPCVSLFVPFFPFDPTSDGRGGLGLLSDDRAWQRFATLRDRVEARRRTDPSGADQELTRITRAWARLEDQLWAEADEVAAADPGPRTAWLATVWPRVSDTLGALGV
jgi:secernin